MQQFKKVLVGSAMLAVLAGCATGTQQGDGADQAAATAQKQEMIYAGTLPCRNCDGIDLKVDMQGQEQSSAAQRTFTLDANYRGHPQNPPTETYQGQWEVLSGTKANPEATVYQLTPQGEGQVYYFLKLDPSTLELIDPQRRRFENGEMLRLQRQ